jgi:LAO/AO transport system kinase
MQVKLLSISEYLEGIRQGDKMILGKAITLIESNNDTHRKAASELLIACKPFQGKSVRIGVTGVPGVGKSTFIDAFGSYLIEKHNKHVGVLAIDPSSARSQGSILGDKTRMSGLSLLQSAYVRPSPSGGDLGGVRQTTSDTICLLEAAGYDIILIETVGVGQSETLVHQLVDFFLLLMLAGAGDSLQGIKRGIMEVADAIVVNKADGDNLEAAKNAVAEYSLGLSHMSNTRENWTSTVYSCSALEGFGLESIWNTIGDFVSAAKEDGSFETNRKTQMAKHFKDDWFVMIKSEFESRAEFRDLYEYYEGLVQNGDLSSRQAAKELIEKLKS